MLRFLTPILALLLVSSIGQADDSSGIAKIEDAGQQYYKASGEILKIQVFLDESGKVEDYLLINDGVTKAAIAFDKADLDSLFAFAGTAFDTCKTELGCHVQLPSVIISVNNGGVIMFECKKCTKPKN